MKYFFHPFLFLSAFVLSIHLFGEESATYHDVNTRESKHEIMKETTSCFRYWDSPSIHYGVAEHRIVGISGLENSFELEDGSTWSMSYQARRIIAGWSRESPILITQNLSLFSIYNYKIVNPDTHTSIEANLFLGPYRNGPYTRYVLEINDFNSTIILNDYTRWEVSDWDSLYLPEWKIGDPVIIGYNSTWSSTCTGLLINVTLNRHIRAQQY